MEFDIHKCKSYWVYTRYQRYYSFAQPYHFTKDVTGVTLEASGHWLGTRTGADGTSTKHFWPQSRLHGQQDN